MWCSSQCANWRIARSCCGQKSHLLWLLGRRRTEFPQVNGEIPRRWIPISILSKAIRGFLALFAQRAIFLCNFAQVVFVKWRFPSKRGGFFWPSWLLLRRLHRLRLPTATGFWHFDNSLSSLCKARTGPSGIWDVERRGGGTSFRIDLSWVSKKWTTLTKHGISWSSKNYREENNWIYYFRGRFFAPFKLQKLDFFYIFIIHIELLILKPSFDGVNMCVALWNKINENYVF